MTNNPTYNSHLSQDAMQAYLKGAMNPSEKVAVEQHLKECEFCSDAVEGLSLASSSSFENIDAINSDIADKAEKGRTVAMPVLMQKIAVAAIVTVLIGVAVYGYFNFSNQQAEKIYAENFEKYPGKFHLDSIIKTKGKKLSTESAAKIAPPPPALQISEPEPIANIEMDTEVLDEAVNKDISSSAYDAESPPPTEERPLPTSDVEITAARKAEVKAKQSAAQQKSQEEYIVESDEAVEFSGTPAAMGNATTRGAIDVRQVLERAMDHYNKNEYLKAIALFDLLIKEEPGNVEALLYGGISYLETNDHGKALIYFERIKKHSPEKYAEEADWYSALTLIKSGKERKAKKLLKDIAEDNGKYAAQAEKILNELE